MTNFLGFLLVLVIIITISYTKRSRQKARASACEKVRGGSEDAEIEEKYRHIALFHKLQEQLLSLRGGKPTFDGEREKLRYFHFILGAIDQLSRTIKDELRSELWGMSASLAQATLLFGVDGAMKHLENYGCSEDAELQKAGERGWHAMRTYILSAAGEVSENDFNASCLELFSVVRGMEPQLKNKTGEIARAKRASFFFNLCTDELQKFTLEVQGKEFPTENDCLVAAVNSKLVYEMFRNVDDLKAEAREMAVALVSQAVNFISQKYDISEEDAGEIISKNTHQNLDNLKCGEEPKLVLPSVKAAYLMTKLAGFDELIGV